MQDSELISFYSSLSKHRLSKYYKVGFSPIAVYDWDISLCQAFYPLLHLVEIALRNRLHTEIANVLNDPHWLLQKNPYIMRHIAQHWIDKIDNNIKNLNVKSKPNEDNLIGELSFGFWTTLLCGNFEHNKLLWPCLKGTVFPYAKGIAVSDIRKRFNKIRKLRNLVFHYQPIWYKQDIIAQYDGILSAIRWIDPYLLFFIDIATFKNLYYLGPKINQSMLVT